MATSESLCDSCTGLCCRGGVFIDLEQKGARFLEEGGAELTGALVHLFPDLDTGDVGVNQYPRFFRKNRRRARKLLGLIEDEKTRNMAKVVLDKRWHQSHVYYTEADCGYLDTTVTPPRCTVYYDDRKPEICSNFEAGGENCVVMRDRAGMVTPVELRPREQGTHPPTG